MTANPSWCSICSEEIAGEPLVELAAAWAAGAETQTVCSPDCLDQLFTQWREYVADLG